MPIPGSRLRRLLTRLAVDGSRRVPVAELIDPIWPDEPPVDVTNALQSLVSRLRKVLDDPGLVQQVLAGYRLAVEPADVDAVEFVALVRDGHRQLQDGVPQSAHATLTRALNLWRGPALADADDADYAVAPIARLAEQRAGAVSDRIEAQLQLDHASEVIAELEELTAAHPLREQVVGQPMTALAAVGRTADALEAFQGLRERLAESLGTDPGSRLQAQHVALLRGEQQASVTPPPAARRTNLRAAVSSFIGREAELDKVAAMVRAGRLTTIVGPVGAGKTRLATEVAAPLVQECRDGVCLVELAPVTNEATIAQSVLNAFGVRDSRILDHRVDGGGSMTLVLDNCEHLISAVAEFAETLLARCPRAKVLATSREPLGLADEAVVSIPPLGLPPAHATAAEAAGYPAVQLLLVRGEAASATFELIEATRQSVVEMGTAASRCRWNGCCLAMQRWSASCWQRVQPLRPRSWLRNCAVCCPRTSGRARSTVTCCPWSGLCAAWPRWTAVTWRLPRLT